MQRSLRNSASFSYIQNCKRGAAGSVLFATTGAICDVCPSVSNVTPLGWTQPVAQDPNRGSGPIQATSTASDHPRLFRGVGAASIDSVARLKFKGGYDLGRTLIYATTGAARADTSVGNESGAFVGLGAKYKITDRYTIGAELLEHRFNDIGGTAGADVESTTFDIRGSIRF